jgi:hypothetical protein
MKLKIKQGTTSKLIRLFVQDSAATDGSGKTGIAYNASGLSAYYLREGDSTATQITLASGTTGTYSSGGWSEVDATNLPGIYEVGLPDACVDATSEGSVVVMFKGATDMAPVLCEIELDAVDYRDATDFGLSNLDAAVSTRSTFDHSTNQVTVATNNDKTGYSIAGSKTTLDDLNDIAATAIVSAGAITTSGGAVSNVTLVNTTTTNSDMITASSVADAVWDESLSSHNTGGSAGKALKNLKEGIVSYEGQVNDASATTTSFITNLASSIDDFYNSQTIHFISGTLQGQSRLVLDYDGSTKQITVEEPLSSAPANGTEFIILSTHVHTMAEIADGVWDEAQSGHTTVGTFGYFLDAQVSGAGAGGSGLYQVTVRVEDSGNNALQGARVNVDGTLLTLATGSSGEVTFNLDSGVYLLNVSPPAGYTTPIGQVVTVTTSDISETFTLLGSGTCSPGWVG